MKWLLLLVLILVLVAMIAYRYRQYILSVWFMWQTFRRFRQQVRPVEKQVPKKNPAEDTELVRCPKCNKWTPQGEAVKLKSNYFCSLQCLEESISVKA